MSSPNSISPESSIALSACRIVHALSMCGSRRISQPIPCSFPGPFADPGRLSNLGR